MGRVYHDFVKYSPLAVRLDERLGEGWVSGL